MLIIGLKKYRDGFKGFYEEGEKYVYFSLAAGKLRILVEYYCRDYYSRHQFIELVGRFYPRNIFLKNPVEIGKLCMDELRKIVIARQSFSGFATAGNTFGKGEKIKGTWLVDRSASRLAFLKSILFVFFFFLALICIYFISHA